MSAGGAGRPHGPWAAVAIGVTGVIAVVAAVTGFIILPMLQNQVQFQGVWDAICSAAGLVGPASTEQQVVQAGFRTTQVELTPQMLSGTDAESIGRGATLALRCTMCHGARGLSAANSPNLAAQYDGAIYKQLQDFKSGARVSAVMDPLAADLSPRDMRELADYYAYLPRPPWTPPGPAPRIVLSGAPLRGIAPCGSCHGQIAHKLGTPLLEGQPVAYLRAQMLAFKSGERRNDVNEIMRNIARRMTDQEIDAAAEYYGVNP